MSKDLFYDWFGYNSTIFHHAHHFTENKAILNTLKTISDYIGNYRMFPIHFILLLAVMFFLLRKHKHSDKTLPLVYTKSIILLLTSMVAALSIGQLIKVTLEYARPYCTSSTLINKIVAEIMDYKVVGCFKSMPSGHSLYIAVFILSIWPILNCWRCTDYTRTNLKSSTRRTFPSRCTIWCSTRHNHHLKY